ncbi:hypothetical protein JB92DRAFT_2838996 [Gautieria morchelliformis]|nr:hypothetical protein JB92DRAFT_2838996 [Gautieria morchelliformis]
MHVAAHTPRLSPPTGKRYSSSFGHRYPASASGPGLRLFLPWELEVLTEEMGQERERVYGGAGDRHGGGRPSPKPASSTFLTTMTDDDEFSSFVQASIGGLCLGAEQGAASGAMTPWWRMGRGCRATPALRPLRARRRVAFTFPSPRHTALPALIPTPSSSHPSPHASPPTFTFHVQVDAQRRRLNDSFWSKIWRGASESISGAHLTMLRHFEHWPEWRALYVRFRFGWPVRTGLTIFSMPVRARRKALSPQEPHTPAPAPSNGGSDGDLERKVALHSRWQRKGFVHHRESEMEIRFPAVGCQERRSALQTYTIPRAACFRPQSLMVKTGYSPTQDTGTVRHLNSQASSTGNMLIPLIYASSTNTRSDVHQGTVTAKGGLCDQPYRAAIFLCFREVGTKGM